MLGKKNPTTVRLDLEAAVCLALEMEARACQTEVHSSQVNQGANQVDCLLYTSPSPRD